MAVISYSGAAMRFPLRSSTRLMLGAATSAWSEPSMRDITTRTGKPPLAAPMKLVPKPMRKASLSTKRTSERHFTNCSSSTPTTTS